MEHKSFWLIYQQHLLSINSTRFGVQRAGSLVRLYTWWSATKRRVGQKYPKKMEFMIFLYLTYSTAKLAKIIAYSDKIKLQNIYYFALRKASCADCNDLLTLNRHKHLFPFESNMVWWWFDICSYPVLLR